MIASKTYRMHDNRRLSLGFYFCSFSLPFIFQGDLIPGNASLIFEMTCIHIADGPIPPNVFKLMDTDKDQKLTKEEVTLLLGVEFSLF